MLQFSRKTDVGRCGFADRYQFRLELSWRKVIGPPDYNRMLSDYQAKLERERGMENSRRIATAGWQGLEGRIGSQMTSRFGWYAPTESLLLEAVFVWPQDRDKGLERLVLASIGEEPVRSDGLRPWRAFGMNVLASDDLSLQDCQVEPGLAKLVFGRPNSEKFRETFERIGMVSHWLNGTVREWLLGRLEVEAREPQAATDRIADHQIETVLVDSTNRRGGRSWFGRGGCYRTAAWICPTDGRLYRISERRPTARTSDNLPLAGGRLCCCKSLSETYG